MKVFISYRRTDDPNFAWRLRDQLAHQLGEPNVFFDIDSLLVGVDFVESIRQVIGTSDCVLVVIGPRWQPERLAREEDNVRMEVLEANLRRKLIVPVLSDDTPMPTVDQLPEPLWFLSRRHAATISTNQFERDVSLLLKRTRLRLPDQPQVRDGPPPGDDPGPELVGSSLAWTDQGLRTLSGHDGNVLCLAFDPTGVVLASGGSDNSARLWDADSGTSRLKVTVKGGRVSAVGLTAGGTALLSSSGDVVHIWDTESGRRRATLSGHTGTVWGLALAPDAGLVATASADNTARLWDLHHAEATLSLRGHTGWVTSVALSPNGGCLATGSTDNTCRIWDAESGRSLSELRGHSRSVTAVAFAPDGRWLASGSADGTGRVWDLATGSEHSVLAGHSDTITSIAFSRDARLVVTSGINGTCRTWERSNGRPVRAFAGHEGRVHAVATAPDGRTFASAGADGTIRLWSLLES